MIFVININVFFFYPFLLYSFITSKYILTGITLGFRRKDGGIGASHREQRGDAFAQPLNSSA